MTLREACATYLVRGQQGQLVIKFSGDVHLCKILVEDGQAVHIAHGRMAPEEILASLAGKTVEWVNFIAGYPVRKHLELPLHEQLLEVISGQSGQPAAVVNEPPETTPASNPAPPATAPVDDDSGIPSATVEEAIQGLIEQIGPLGRILAERIGASLHYLPGNPMPKASYQQFVAALAKEVPEADQTSFLNKYQLPN